MEWRGKMLTSLVSLVSLFGTGSRILSHSLALTGQYMRRSRNLLNWSRSRGLVNMSAICSKVKMCSMVIHLEMTCERKWWRRTDRCFVRRQVLWLVAISMQLLLSSKTRHLIIGVEWLNRNFLDFNSFNKSRTEITSGSNEDNAIYPASVVLNKIRDCILEAHKSGQLAYITTKPDW